MGDRAGLYPLIIIARETYTRSTLNGLPSF